MFTEQGFLPQHGLKKNARDQKYQIIYTQELVREINGLFVQ